MVERATRAYARHSTPVSARVTIDGASDDRVRIELRQSAGEVTQFVAFVLIVLGALYTSLPKAREAPALLLALLGIAVGWVTVAMTGRELYTIDESTGTIDALISATVWRHRQQIPIRHVVAVRMATGGPDDNRLLVEVVDADGSVRLRLPHRISTLDERDQAEIARLIAARLDLPLRRDGHAAKLQASVI